MNDENVKTESVDEIPDIPAEENQVGLSDTEKLQADLENSQKELLYLRAEFDNFRKQSIKERSELIKFAGEAMARDFLGVVDIFEKALATEVTADNFQSFVDGVKLTEKGILDVFTKHGVKELDCKHKPFDPSQAEALSQVPTADVEEGHVFDVMRKGYSFHGKVLRHAQVVLATKPAETKG